MTITEALQLLELMPPFTAAHAKKAFREAHLVWHPDRFPTNPELHAKAHARTCLINDAFDVISRALQAGYDFTTIASPPTRKRRKAASPEPPTNAAEFNRRGLTYHRAGRPNKAIADFSQAIQLDPSVAEYYRNRGLVYANRRRLPNAIADFTEAVQLDPDICLDPVDAYSFRARAAVHALKGEDDKAILDLTEAIQLEPGVVECHGRRGVLYRKKGDLDKAVADFIEVSQLDPKRRRWFRRDFRRHGALCESRGEYDKAIADYSEVIQSFRGTDTWHELTGDYFNRARAYRATGQLDNAIADYGKAIELYPRTVLGDGWRSVAPYFKCRAQTYCDKGDFTSAIADLTEAMRRDPEGIWWIEHGLTRFKGPNPNDEGWTHRHALATLATLCAEAGDFSHAIQYQTAFLQLPDVTAAEATAGLRCLKLYHAHLAIPHIPS